MLKKIISLVTAAVMTSAMLFSATVSAATSGTVAAGGAWSYDESTRTLTLESGRFEESISSPAWKGNIIEHAVIGADVTYVSGSSLASNANLESITVEAGNSIYAAVDGVLFNIQGNTLVCYPRNKAGSDYEIPSGVTSIAQYAFYHNEKVRVVDIPDTVTELQDYAFNMSKVNRVNLGSGVKKVGLWCFLTCQELKTISMHTGITEVKQAAFANLTALSTVIFDGTESELKTIDTNGNANGNLVNAYDNTVLSAADVEFVQNFTTNTGIAGEDEASLWAINITVKDGKTVTGINAKINDQSAGVDAISTTISGGNAVIGLAYNRHDEDVNRIETTVNNGTYVLK